MDLSEESMRYLEEHIPELAKSAITQAYWGALASGSSVLESHDGFLIEVYPDGTRKKLRKLMPAVKVTLGQRLEIK